MSERRGTKALELWCKRLVKDCPDVQIDNMTTSWRNGIAFCALVHHFRPDLIDMCTLKPDNIYENNRLAFTIAEKHLGIPALLDPEDMVENDVPDRLSILTYLSQFYQRLGHTVNPKVSASEAKLSSPPTTTESPTPIRFGKVGLDKCTVCGLPVYLAQRLIVSQKLYHRRCFRCSKCLGHLNPKNFEYVEGTEITCDSCKNEKTLSKYLNNKDQMGMLAYSDASHASSTDTQLDEPINPKHKSRPQSILEKISMFEKNVDKDAGIGDKLGNLSLKDNIISKNRELSISSIINNSCMEQSESIEKLNAETGTKQTIESKTLMDYVNSSLHKDIPEKVYKSNIDKFNFLQTQLSTDTLDDSTITNIEVADTKYETQDCTNIVVEKSDSVDKSNDTPNKLLKEESNITDDSRIARSHSTSSNLNISHSIENTSDLDKHQQEISISVPPRKKKNIASMGKVTTSVNKSDDKSANKLGAKEYPDHLNPFSDDEEEHDEHDEPVNMTKKVSKNPFGSSDEEDDDVPPIYPPPKVPTTQTSTPVKRLISAFNPFWSDGEEPSSDDESHSESSTIHKSSLTTSTPNLPSSTPRRKKAKAPPPPIITVSEAPSRGHMSTSMDDIASISSEGSYNSTIHSDQKSFGRATPRMTKRPAPTPPDSLSTVSGGGGSMEKGVDTSGICSNTSDGGGRRTKGPAPGLPLPERREVKLQMSPEELQVQLDLLETQQLGVERQGVLIEQMIRDKCEGDEATSAPQEEVEDLVIQLCELVNEKNDLFRKQTELMYIRRQQRLEQEQADIEHEIRVIQSRPAVNRIDADKAREEQLVSRLVAVVRARDELVQQIDAERRRERQEDLAIAASIATKRAQRSSESNSSSMKSMEVVTPPKKNKVKDKMKKQFKKAKHTLISKKKDDSGDRKEEKIEKEKKSK